jgi:ABC-type antimicrobial peptide transport system permease subunit
VNQRIPEFGVRMALGARPADVIRSVLAQGLKLASAGIVCGVCIGLILARLLGNLVYGVHAADPVTLALTIGVALGTAALACYLPARRATRVDPMTALRSE